jgi:Tfp pilus assembly protein PilF
MELNLDRDRVAELHLRLIDEQDRGRRAAMHLELASLALRDGNIEQAARHFREALLLDDTLDRARAGLKDLGERSQVHTSAGRKGLMRALMDKIRHRG